MAWLILHTMPRAAAAMHLTHGFWNKLKAENKMSIRPRNPLIMGTTLQARLQVLVIPRLYRQRISGLFSKGQTGNIWDRLLGNRNSKSRSRQTEHVTDPPWTSLHTTKDKNIMQPVVHQVHRLPWTDVSTDDTALWPDHVRGSMIAFLLWGTTASYPCLRWLPF